MMTAAEAEVSLIEMPSTLVPYTWFLPTMPTTSFSTKTEDGGTLFARSFNIPSSTTPVLAVMAPHIASEHFLGGLEIAVSVGKFLNHNTVEVRDAATFLADNLDNLQEQLLAMDPIDDGSYDIALFPISQNELETLRQASSQVRQDKVNESMSSAKSRVPTGAGFAVPVNVPVVQKFCPTCVIL